MSDTSMNAAPGARPERLQGPTPGAELTAADRRPAAVSAASGVGFSRTSAQSGDGLPAGVGEVEIRGDHVGELNAWAIEVRAKSNRVGASIVSSERVLAEIAAHRRRGTRVLLVTLETCGGNAQASVEIYRALRAFSWAGGTVVVHVHGWTASSGPFIALAGNYVLMAPGAKLVLHRAGGDNRIAAQVSKRELGLYALRTFAPRHLLEEWLSRTDSDNTRPPYAELPADVAVYYGFADRVATREEALAFAGSLAGGLTSLVEADAADLAVVELAQSRELAGVAMYFPQASTGGAENTPGTRATLPSIIDGISVGVKNGVVPDAGGTRGGAVENIWPNPTSESDPPAGADLSRAEWLGRVNLGIGTAPAGAWVRSPGTGASLAIDFTIPAIPGETYYLEALVAAASAGANKGGFVKITALDSLGATISSAGSAENDTVSFGLRVVSFVMPAGTTQARFSLVNGSDAAAHAYFDTILARRSIDLKLFSVEPWAATRLIAMCRVVVNAAGTSASYSTAADAIGFDPVTSPALVQVGTEPQKRLRLTLGALPNSQSLANMRFFLHAQRNANGGGIGLGSPSCALLLQGWNLALNTFDLWPFWEDWTSGFYNTNSPFAWGSIDPTNGSTWDVALFLAAPFPFKFF